MATQNPTAFVDGLGVPRGFTGVTGLVSTITITATAADSAIGNSDDATAGLSFYLAAYAVANGSTVRFCEETACGTTIATGGTPAYALVAYGTAQNSITISVSSDMRSFLAKYPTAVLYFVHSPSAVEYFNTSARFYNIQLSDISYTTTDVEMVSELSNKPIYALAAMADASGNRIDTVYATKAQLPAPYTAGNMIGISNNTVAVSTTAGITDIQVVSTLPQNPVSTVLYLIPET